jgi:predicted MFS family arabinose efflux permease
VVGALVAGAALTAAFLAWERRAPSPVLPLQLFASRAFSAASAATFFLSAALFGTVYFMAQFLQAVGHTGPLGAGLRLLPWTATLFFVAPLAGRWITRVGERPFVAGGLLLQAAGMGWMALIISPGLAYGRLVAPFVIAGAGVSMALPAVQSAILGAVDPGHIGKASGTFNTLRQLGAAFGVAIGVAVFVAAGSYASPQAFSDGLAPAIAVAAALSLAGALAGAALPWRAAAVASDPLMAPRLDGT